MSNSKKDVFYDEMSFIGQVYILFYKCFIFSDIGLWTTFNNFSVILWRSALLVEETGVPRENNRTIASHCQIYHIMLH